MFQLSLEARQWGLLGTYEKRLSAPETFLTCLPIGEAPVIVLMIGEAPEGIGEVFEMSLLLYLSVRPLLTGSSCISSAADIELCVYQLFPQSFEPLQLPLLSIHSEVNIERNLFTVQGYSVLYISSSQYL